MVTYQEAVSRTIVYATFFNQRGQVERIKKDNEGDANDKDCKYEIQQLLFNNNISKHLIENIECELDG